MLIFIGKPALAATARTLGLHALVHWWKCITQPRGFSPPSTSLNAAAALRFQIPFTAARKGLVILRTSGWPSQTARMRRWLSIGLAGATAYTKLTRIPL